jgi:hypothetical protein
VLFNWASDGANGCVSIEETVLKVAHILSILVCLHQVRVALPAITRISILSTKECRLKLPRRVVTLIFLAAALNWHCSMACCADSVSEKEDGFEYVVADLDFPGGCCCGGGGVGDGVMFKDWIGDWLGSGAFRFLAVKQKERKCSIIQWRE